MGKFFGNSVDVLKSDFQEVRRRAGHWPARTEKMCVGANKKIWERCCVRRWAAGDGGPYGV